MSIAGNQQQTYLRLASALRPHWRRDPAFATRLQQLLARERAFGSRDRRLYRELLYTTVRFAPWIEPLLTRDPARAAAVAAWLAAELPATRDYRQAVAGALPPCPPGVAAKAAILEASVDALLPAWLAAECPAALAAAEVDALHRRAPLWLRLQTDDSGAVAADFAAHGWNARPSPLRPEAWEVLSDADVTRCDSHQRGRFEIQDLGSQLILASVAITPGGHWYDACAGAGGKSLQLARLLGPAGRVEAHDIRPAALEDLGLRASRAGFRTIVVRRTPPPADARYDGVLVDAPCSGSGTWRRAPHFKWITTPEHLAQQAARQLTLLTQAAAWVRSGGQLIYATCSLAQRENGAVVAAFLAAHPEFSVEPPAQAFGFAAAGPGLAILPARHDTDGFYVATLRRA